MRLSEIQARHYKQKKTSSGWSASTNSLDLADPEHAALLMRRCCSDVDDTGGGRGVEWQGEGREAARAAAAGTRDVTADETSDPSELAVCSDALLDALLVVDAYHPLHRLNACSHHC